MKDNDDGSLRHRATGSGARGIFARQWRWLANRSAFAADLEIILAERNFRRLFATRLTSQLGDGIFTAGLGAYVFFNKSTFPNPAAAAAAFAVLYLPYSIIGPFAGVFIDRWSRRQILVWSALLRAVFVVFTASLVASGNLGTPLYVGVLAVLGVDRFFLSSLSASLPHVVPGEKLVMANSVSPTTGTIMTFVGGLAGLGMHLATGSGRGGSAVTLLVAGGCYVLAGTIAATMHRSLLGPPALPPGAERPGLAAELMVVLRGLASGARHAWQRRPVAAALGATGSQRAMYGILFLAAILLYRNYFYVASGANSALASFTVLVAASGIGYGSAAFVTPWVTRRLSTAAWIAILLVGGGVITAALGSTFQQIPFLFVGFGLGLVAQGVAICATTIIQLRMDDSYRGRVFAFYDMLYNVPFVLAAVLAAQVMPDDGKSFVLIMVVGGGYVLAGIAYAVVSRHELVAPSPPASSPGPPGRDPGGPSGPDSPSAAAHFSSS